mgnify:CR=1 FL=1|jgi:hyperosmotically inducible protein
MALFPEAGRSPNSAQPKVLLNPPGLSHPLFLHNLNPTLTMKSMSKPVVLALVLAGSLGSVLFTGGCAATSTQASTGQYIDDSSITVKVKAAFVKDPLIKAFDVSVETFKGVVQLSGFVNTAAEKEQAGKVAATISGVTEVKNNIAVK